MSLPDCPACEVSPRLRIFVFSTEEHLPDDKRQKFRYCPNCTYSEPAQKGDSQ